jgi:phospholipid/cholesterol/gamma-HCH transport system substrate-binding protein
METRANYALIGIFTLAVIATGFLFVLWFSGGDTGKGRQAVQIVFSGSVSGLSKGSVVTFNGLRIGEVTELRLLPDDPRRVSAVIEVDRATPVRADTRARLEFQGLTGVATIALVGGEPGSPPLQPPPGQSIPTLFADRSDFQDLMESARNIARRADDVLERVGKVVSDNEGPINRTVLNAEAFSRALSENAPAVAKFMEQVGQAAERIGPLAVKLESLTEDVQKLVRSVEPHRVARSVENIEGFTNTLAQNRENVSNTLRDVASLAKRLDGSAEKLDATLTDFGSLVRAVDAARINRSFDNIEAFTATLKDNRQNVDTILKDAATLAGRLNATTTKADTALDDVSKLIRSVDAQMVNRTLANIEGFTLTLAENRQNVDSILKDVAALTKALDVGKVNRSLDNVEAFTATLKDNRQNVDTVLKDAAALTGRLNTTATKADTALDDVSKLIRSVDAQMVNRTLANVEGFTLTLAENRQNVDSILRDAAALTKALDVAKVNRAIDGAERFATTLGNASPEVDKTIKEARSLAEKLNKSADRIDGVLKAAESFLGSASGKEGEGMFGEIRQAARSIRTLADNLDKRTADIASGINRFTGSGLREVESLTIEGRRTLTDIGRAVRSLEKNPQQIIFGGGKGNIPEYRGRP